ncbi:hypothetical protein F0562_005084 [Nyssa sinensis]|uniref:Starch synthase catalytic domain-containing protein n=1 Tax=Nyssa sinensis TaxID=561372 RepID=A0A5J5AH32_9ASTE|nr:hypothetical protein F0562_005084 [Nyssa sinensis]
MASIGSLPFVIDTVMDNSILLYCGNFRRPVLPFFAYRPRKSFDSGGLNDPTFGYSKVVGEDNARFSLCCNRLISGCNGGQLSRIKHLRATGKDSGDVEDGDESEDALHATIEKSKKVLAMQRDLLQKIAERRKLVSTIESSTIDPESDEVSYEERGSSFSSLDTAASTSGDDADNTGILSSSNFHPTVDEVPEAQPLVFSDEFGEGVKELEKDLPLQKSSLDTDSRKQLKDNTSNSKRVWSDELPSFLSKSSATSNLKDEKHEDLKESSLEEVNGEATVPSNEDVRPPPLAGANVMNVILVSAECAPWSKTGGLGDVAGALPKALARRGHRVMVVAPRYGNYAEPQHTDVRKMYRVDRQDMEVTFFQTYIDGVDFVFIDAPIFRNIENNIYGGNRMDILKRMVLFCKATVEVPWNVPCGGAYYRDNGLMKYTRSILVIHNIAHQGRGPIDDFSYVDLPPHYLDLFRLYDPVGGEHLNIFAAGLKAADRIVTVSHGYAWELKTSEGGWGLHDIINENDWKLKGIVNGIDTKEWNPELDIHLQSDGYTNYSLETLQTGKAQCKAALQKELGLPIRDDVPLIGFIGRLDHQKGRPDLEQMLRQFESQHDDKVRGWVGFSVKTAHRITAGSDILLMPSRFEPCGLNQLYAMMYGTIPVVHAVGGLRDTVQPFNPFDESGLGWTFDSAEANKLIDALGNCLLTYREYKKSWEGIQRRGMMQDLSWDNAAQNYEEVLVAAKYQWLIKDARVYPLLGFF